MAAEGMAGAPRGLAERVINTKLIKGPQTFSGEKKDWKRWSAKLTGYVSGVDMNLLELMRVAAVQKEVVYLAEIAPIHRDASGVLHSVLNGLFEGDSGVTLSGPGADTSCSCSREGSRLSWQPSGSRVRSQRDRGCAAACAVVPRHPTAPGPSGSTSS